MSTGQNPRNGIPLGLSPGLRASLALTPEILTRQHIENSFMFQGRSHRHQTLKTLETSQVINLTLNRYHQTRGYAHPLASTVVLEASGAGNPVKQKHISPISNEKLGCQEVRMLTSPVCSVFFIPPEPQSWELNSNHKVILGKLEDSFAVLTSS